MYAERARQLGVRDLGNARPLRVGHSGADVRELQRFLVDEGYDCGGRDGYFGESTAGALARWQRDVGVRATGTFDAATKTRYLSRAEGYYFHDRWVGGDFRAGVVMAMTSMVVITVIGVIGVIRNKANAVDKRDGSEGNDGDDDDDDDGEEGRKRRNDDDDARRGRYFGGREAWLEARRRVLGRDRAGDRGGRDV